MGTTAFGNIISYLTAGGNKEDHTDGWTFNLTGEGEHDHLFTITENRLLAAMDYISPERKQISVLAERQLAGQNIEANGLLTLPIIDQSYTIPIGKGLMLHQDLIISPTWNTTYRILMSYKFNGEDITLLSHEGSPCIIHLANGAIQIYDSGVIVFDSSPIGYMPSLDINNIQIIREDRGDGLKTYYEMSDEVIYISDINILPELSAPLLLFDRASTAPPVEIDNLMIRIDGIDYVHIEHSISGHSVALLDL